MPACVPILPLSMDSHADAHFRHSYTKDRKELLNRLRRIEGQVRGIQRLVQNEAYCLDILQQVEAVTAAAAKQLGSLRRSGPIRFVGPSKPLISWQP